MRRPRTHKRKDGIVEIRRHPRSHRSGTAFARDLALVIALALGASLLAGAASVAGWPLLLAGGLFAAAAGWRVRGRATAPPARPAATTPAAPPRPVAAAGAPAAGGGTAPARASAKPPGAAPPIVKGRLRLVRANDAA